MLSNLLLLLPLVATPCQVMSPPCLEMAHAHNDYLHKRPLIDALEKGFTSVEADVFSVGDKLLVAHSALELLPPRTLEALYLNPLEKLAAARPGKLRPDGKPLWLLVDIKNDPEKTWELLRIRLEARPGLFCRWEKGKRINGPVWVVVSGSVPRKAILEAEPRLASVDGRLADLGKKTDPEAIPWISDAWSGQFRWRGNGLIPKADQEKMREMVRQAQAEGKQLRFWGAPDNAPGWQAQRDAGVHRLGTDKLADLAEFLKPQQ